MTQKRRDDMCTEEECGCKVVSAFLTGNTIEYCPKHKAAEDMYEALKEADKVICELCKKILHRENCFICGDRESRLIALEKAAAK